LLSDAYSKEVALLIDSARPGMVMTVNMQSAKEVSDKNGILFDKVVSIQNHYVKITLSGNESKSYQFFNDINVTAYPDNEKGFDGYYVLTFDKKT
jgi:hypothetical protein